MGGDTKHHRSVAMRAAEDVATRLREHCLPDYFKFAGSLRRMKNFVGDIEAVFVPLVVEETDKDDLLGAKVQVNKAEKVIGDLLRDGVLRMRTGPKGGTAWGPSNKLAVHMETGVPLDLFSTDEASFWSLLVCRTGPKDFNAAICVRAHELGEKWNPYKGFTDPQGVLKFQPRSELELFQHLGWDWVEPKDRT